ncbi:MAG: hypothetical protein K9L70_12070 [Thiohalocapsa sp.]|jgi:hypothetical protein|nr:hypothetical protein [Thiohalocapsa sp.]MCF7989067.1 hypothetical protein [Thiohalocapsa sp.]
MNALTEALALVLFLSGLFGVLGLMAAGYEWLGAFAGGRPRRGQRMPALRVPRPMRERSRRRRRRLPAHAARGLD